MKNLVYLLFLSAAAASAQTAVWPNAVVTDSQLLVAANLCGTRLSGSISDTTSTTIFVNNASVSPTCFKINEEIQVDSEFMQITSVGFGQITVVRGFDNSTASTHNNNAPVNVVPAGWYHNALAKEIESVETWLQNGGGGGGGSMNYSQGSTNAAVQTVTGKLRQYLSVDDFSDNLGNPVSPTATAVTNAQGIQNAINYAAPLGIILTCQGNYQINSSLTILNGMRIFGHGEGVTTSATSGCSFQQTASVPMWVQPPGTVSSFQLQDMQFSGFTYGIYMVGTGSSGPNTSGISDTKLVRTHWTPASGGAMLHMNNYAFIQDIYTEYNVFNGGGRGTNCWEELGSASSSNGYIVSWESHHDTWGLCDTALNIDTPNGGNAGSWDIFSPHFVGTYKSVATIAGNVRIINIFDGAAEQVMLNDPSPLTVSTCTTSAPASTTLTCASSNYQNGQVLTVQGGATNGTFGGSNPGWDMTVTVINGGGTTTLTVNPAVTLQVTSAYTTNAQYDCFAFIKSPETSVAPDLVTIKNFGGAACNHRYFINAAFTHVGLDSQALASGGTFYDPNAYGAVIGYTPVSVSVPFPQFRTAYPYTVAGNQPYYFRPYTGDTQMPTVLGGNPKSGTLFSSCGDNLSNSCGTSGNYGPWWFQANGQGKSMLWMDPITFTTWLGKSGPVSGLGNNVIIGQGTKPTSANNTLTLYAGTAPSGGTSFQGTFSVNNTGDLSWTNGAGTVTALSGGTGIWNPDNAVGTVSGTGCAAYSVQDGRGYINVTAVTTCTYTFSVSALRVCTANQYYSSGTTGAVWLTSVLGTAVTFTFPSFTGKLAYVCQVFY